MGPSSSSERTRRILTLFEQAVELEASDREAFLDEACKENEQLRREIELLLDAYSRDGLTDELNEALKSSLSPWLSTSHFEPGKRVAHYEIIERLGIGGMGVVYKARDTKLDRLVALKFLAPHLSAHEEAKPRFIHEAKAASALDHTNICTIYEINETEEGLVFIAMAYYGGETLKQRIGRGPLPVEDAVEIAYQMAEGLGRAHEAGIVHRDVKPANVIVTERGDVKLLDFGIAKLEGASGLTKQGATLGTVAYMSPEQASGGDIDHQTDLWSLGVVLYEMLTGERPFRGEHEQAIIYSILNSDPNPVATARSEIPALLVSLVNRLLQKKSSNRYPGMDEVVTGLQYLREGTSSGQVFPVSRSRRLLHWIVPVFLVALATGFFFLREYLSNGEQPTTRYRQVTFSGQAKLPALSPDGETLAYVDNDEKVMVKDLQGGNAIEIFSGTRFSSLEWSPDGTELLISSNAELTIVPRLGGPPQILPLRGYGNWSPDGSKIATFLTSEKVIKLINRAAMDTTSINLREPFGWFFGLNWSPNGNWFALYSLSLTPRHARLHLISNDGRMQNIVMEDSSDILGPRWSPDGKALYYFLSNGSTWDMMKQPIDPRNGTSKGPPRQIMSGLQTSFELSGSNFSLDRTGSKLLYQQQISYSNLSIASLKGDEGNLDFRPLTSGTLHQGSPGISPDGEWIAYIRAKNIYVQAFNGTEPRQLTFTHTDKYSTSWSPDGKEIVFLDLGKNFQQIWSVSVSTGTLRHFENTNASADITWTPGDEIVYSRVDNRTLIRLDPDTEQEETLVDEDVGWTFSPTYSPDGKHIAFFWNRKTSDGGLWVLSIADGTHHLIHEGQSRPFGWSEDGSWIYFYQPQRPEILRIQRNGGQIDTVAVLPSDLPYINPLSMTSDGQQFVFIESETRSDIWIIENFEQR